MKTTTATKWALKSTNISKSLWLTANGAFFCPANTVSPGSWQPTNPMTNPTPKHGASIDQPALLHLPVLLSFIISQSPTCTTTVASKESTPPTVSWNSKRVHKTMGFCSLQTNKKQEGWASMIGLWTLKKRKDWHRGMRSLTLVFTASFPSRNHSQRLIRWVIRPTK